MDLKELLNKLTPEQKAHLMYAFEHGIASFVKLEGGVFVGVHVTTLQHLNITETKGAWSCGVINE